MSGDTEYAKIDVPSDESLEDLHYTHRRAHILQRIIEAGHERALTQRELADDYGVSATQINKDLKVIRSELGKEFRGEFAGEFRSMLRTSYDRAVRDALEDGNSQQVFQMTIQLGEMMMELGDLERAPARVEGEVTHKDGGTSESYEIIDAEDVTDADADDDGDGDASAPAITDGGGE
jgi:hypothetical protein